MRSSSASGTAVAERAAPTPRLDPSIRCVTFRSRTITVPETHVAVVALLVERFGDVIGDDEILELWAEHGVSTHAEAVKTTLRRIKDALAPLGLRLSRVRTAGDLDRMG